jgi:hypothetical protein
MVDFLLQYFLRPTHFLRHYFRRRNLIRYRHSIQLPSVTGFLGISYSTARTIAPLHSRSTPLLGRQQETLLAGVEIVLTALHSLDTLYQL